MGIGASGGGGGGGAGAGAGVLERAQQHGQLRRRVAARHGLGQEHHESGGHIRSIVIIIKLALLMDLNVIYERN